MKMTQCVCHWANYSPAITTYSDKYRFVMQPLCGIYPLITLINRTEHTTEKILKAYTKVDNKTKGCWIGRQWTEYYLDFIATICKPYGRKQWRQDMSVVLAGVIKWSNNTTFSLNQRVLAGVTGNLVDKQQQRLVVPSRWSRLEMIPNKRHQEKRYKTETSNSHHSKRGYAH